MTVVRTVSFNGTRTAEHDAVRGVIETLAMAREDDVDADRYVMQIADGHL